MSLPLPETFLEEMKEMLGKEYEAYLDSFKRPSCRGLRVNTLKWTAGECQKRVPAKLTPVPWILNGFFYEEEERLSKDPYYFAGLYYLQEPSAMTPASLLPVEPGDRVLDLCAAPGGKSTELGARLQGSGLLFSNDISSSRAKALLKNLELFGISNVCVTSETPQKLRAAYPEYFDKILVDAPCSGEGMFRKNPAMAKDWLKKGPAYYAEIQKEILEQAVAMLRPGGTLLYSTCTFSRQEDEEVILTTLAGHEEMEMVLLPLFEGAVDGFGLSGCLRLFPHRILGEGHFMAMMRKKGRKEESEEVCLSKKDRGKGLDWKRVDLEKETELREFLKEINRDYCPERLFVTDSQVYYLPEDFCFVPGLHYLRTGLFLGTLKKGRFEPSQALAMTLGAETFSNSLSFSYGDERVIRYLKGETLSLREEESGKKGWSLVCVDGFGLGFGKRMGLTLKNKYYSGWRWM